MSDLISRCELFNKLATIPVPPEANEFKAEVYKILQQMETADDWIPCSDRFPNKDDEYLTTIKIGDAVAITISHWYGRWGFVWTDPDDSTTKVIAWMPLPKPYMK